MNPLIFSPIRNEFNFCEFTLNWNYLLREFTIISLSVSRIHYEFTFFYANTGPDLYLEVERLSKSFFPILD